MYFYDENKHYMNFLSYTSIKFIDNFFIDLIVYIDKDFKFEQPQGIFLKTTGLRFIFTTRPLYCYNCLIENIYLVLWKSYKRVTKTDYMILVILYW